MNFLNLDFRSKERISDIFFKRLNKGVENNPGCTLIEETDNKKTRESIMKKQKIAVVGCGKMGKIYINNMINHLGMNPHDDIIVYDIDQAKSAKISADFAVSVANNMAEVAKKEVAIVATNTPSHVRVIRELAANGVKHVLCEKPLGLNHKEVQCLKDLETEVFTAFLINFSPALKKVVKIMEENQLVLLEGSAIWIKNRLGDNRPTAGDLEDEVVHPVQAMRMLAGINTNVTSTEVATQLTYLDYVNRAVQARACARDPSFPQSVNASSNILMKMQVFDVWKNQNSIIPVTVRSSYVGAKQVRMVEGVLGYSIKTGVGPVPVYAFYIDFDMAGEDVLTLTRLYGDRSEEFRFKGNKILLELQAFLSYVNNKETDPRLTGLDDAVASVAFTDAAMKSFDNGGKWVVTA